MTYTLYGEEKQISLKYTLILLSAGSQSCFSTTSLVDSVVLPRLYSSVTAEAGAFSLYLVRCLVFDEQPGVWCDSLCEKVSEEERKEKIAMAKVNPVQVEKFLKGIDYPASKTDLIKYAEQHGADENVRATLEQLPDQTFHGPVAVSKAIGELDRGGQETAG